MNSIQNNTLEFLSNNKVATICFVDKENKPYCINCFYEFDEKNYLLIFKSSYGTTHDAYVKAGVFVGGTILPESISFLNIKGIQFSGFLLEDQKISEFKAGTNYTKKYPTSLALPGYIWAVQLQYIKFTDNSLGFGNKTIWKAD